MKGLFTTLALFVLMLSCKESGVPVSKPSTFVRYFSDGNPNDAVDVLETSDQGFLILSYSKPLATDSLGKIILTKTSISGNTIWEKTIRSKTSDLRPSSFVAINDITGDTGYVIVGTSQNPSFGTRLFVAKTDIGGHLQDSASYSTKSGNVANYRTGKGTYLKGRGIARTSANMFFVDAQVVNADLISSSDSSIYMAQIDGSTLKEVYSRTFLANTTDVTNRLTLSVDQTRVFMGASRDDSGGPHLYFIRYDTANRPQSSKWAQDYPSAATHNYFENDIFPYGESYHGIIGTHADPNSGIGTSNVKYDSVIFVLSNSASDKRPDASVVREIKLQYATSQMGASLCKTSNGFLLLYTQAVDAGGTNTDYTLAKIDLDGNFTKDWPAPKTFGGKFVDIGKRVLQSSDGGYVVLGTTVLANVETVFLMKTDGGGNIQ
jgi:hypothetical protein